MARHSVRTLGAVLTAGLTALALARPLAAQTWTATASMVTAREGGTITILPSGKVLIAGGGPGNGLYTAEAELYDPIAGTFTPTGTMTTTRANHTATLLPDGTVLMAGGNNSSGYLSSAEIYDPTTGMFTATGSLSTPRTGHTATLLPNGTVLMAAGENASVTATATAELYDPSTGTFTPTGSMLAARYGARAALLGNGKVLITGGFPGGSGVGFLSEAELYDPAVGTFSVTGSMNTARYGFTMTRLNNGQVLAAGGAGNTLQGSQLSSAELYDPSTGQWAFTGDMVIAAQSRTATLLGNGKVLVAGGQEQVTPNVYFSEAELYDPVAGTFTVTASMTAIRSGAVATLLGNGNVLIAGGFNGSAYLSRAELYEAGTGVPPVVTVSTASLSFGDQTFGTTSPSQNVTLSNTGNPLLIITSIDVSPGYAETNTCGSSLAAGASCEISVTFTPTVVGTQDGTLTITDNASGSPQTVSLSGTGTGPVVSLSAPPTFPSEPVGTTSPAETVTVINTGNGSLTLAAIGVYGPFVIASSGTTCSTSSPVAASGSCTVALTFTPTAGGTASGTLAFTDNAGGSPQTLTLTATGQDFTLAVPTGSSSSATASPGGTATYTLAATSIAGFSQAVNLACSGAPSQATCQLSQASVTPSSSGTNVTVTVTTTAPSATAPRILPPRQRRLPAPRGLPMLALLLASMALLVWGWGRVGPSRWRTVFVPLAAALLLAVALTGCGGGGGGGPHNAGTPAGNYTLTVTGTAGSGSTALSHSVTLTLTVS